MRISAGTLLLGIFAVLFGLLGAYVVRKELHKPAPQPVAEKPEPQVITVPVASNDLEPGRKITLGDILLLRLTPEQMRNQGIAGSFMGNTSQIIGRVVKEGVQRGSTFDITQFYPEGTRPSVADRLKPGLRAVTVTVEQDAAVAGFAVPGSVVDVLFRAEEDGQDEDTEETTITLIEAAEVLALNNDTLQGLRATDAQGNATSKSSVTLAVTPSQAVALRVVEGRGSMALALRSPEEAENGEFSTFSQDRPRTLDDLLDRTNTKHKVEVYRGRQMSKVSFKDDQFEQEAVVRSIEFGPTARTAQAPTMTAEPGVPIFAAPEANLNSRNN